MEKLNLKEYSLEELDTMFASMDESPYKVQVGKEIDKRVIASSKEDLIEKAEENKDIQSSIFDAFDKGHPVGYINEYGKQKMGDGTWKYVGKGKATGKVEEKKDEKTTNSIHEYGGKRYKKQENGKWKEVSEHGLTKEEHEQIIDSHEKSGRFGQAIYAHRRESSKLSDKEYSDGDVGLDKKEEKSSALHNKFKERSEWDNSDRYNSNDSGDGKMLEKMIKEKFKNKTIRGLTINVSNNAEALVYDDKNDVYHEYLFRYDGRESGTEINKYKLIRNTYKQDPKYKSEGEIVSKVEIGPKNISFKKDGKYLLDNGKDYQPSGEIQMMADMIDELPEYSPKNNSKMSSLPKNINVGGKSFTGEIGDKHTEYQTRGSVVINDDGDKVPDKNTITAAETLAKQMQEKGFKAEVVFQEKGWLSVIVSDKK